MRSEGSASDWRCCCGALRRHPSPGWTRSQSPLGSGPGWRVATCPCRRSQSCGSCTTVGSLSLCATAHHVVQRRSRLGTSHRNHRKWTILSGLVHIHFTNQQVKYCRISFISFLVMSRNDEVNLSAPPCISGIFNDFFKGGLVPLTRESRDLDRIGPLDVAEIWSHDSFPNLICKNIG